MSEVDYYKVLGVSKNATADEIRKAYRQLSREYHPDRKPGDAVAAEKFKEVQEAESVLGDEEKRAKYDRFGSATFQQGGRAHPGGAGFGGFDGQIDLSSIFGSGGFADLFGGGMGGGPRPSPRPQKGQDAKVDVDVPFQVAAAGGTHPIHLTVGGQSQRLDAKIPSGVQTGSVIRLAGQGHPGQMGAPAGDLLVTIKVAPHPFFRREGNSLLVDVPISISEAVLGAKVDVPTLLEGPVVVTIPPGTSSGAKLRLREKGVPDQKTKQRGDLLVVVKIVVPKEIDDSAKELADQLGQALQHNPRDGMW
ncbi:MAG: molecular chaperone DnaJ [Planctomycetaceae bacterium]|nr:molecular chaperone DnaJ [Planctomycetaceae bacterium]